MTEDPRKTGLKNGLRQLNRNQLCRVIDYPGSMVLDSYNYEDGKFCPLAIGVGLDQWVENPTHELVENILLNMGYKIYNTRGVAGEFYTTNRVEDLQTAAKEVLEAEEYRCDKPLECGSTCYLTNEHRDACMCIGDDPGLPGSCPA